MHYIFENPKIFMVKMYHIYKNMQNQISPTNSLDSNLNLRYT